MTDQLPELLLLSYSPSNVQAIEKILNQSFEIHSFESEEQGWSYLQQNHPTLVICDLQLALSSFALLERLRQLPNKKLAMVPLIVLVGEEDTSSLRDEAIKLGASDFIEMPFSSSELSARTSLHSGLYCMTGAAAEVRLKESGPMEQLQSLINERQFSERLIREISFSARHQTYLSLCMLSIENAESIAAEQGSKLLQALNHAVSQIIEKTIRREDSYAYLGEDEFGVIFPATNGIGAQTVIRRLADRIESTTLRHNQQEFKITIKAGLFTVMPDAEDQPESLIETVRLRLQKALQSSEQIFSHKTERQMDQISVEQAINLIRFNRNEQIKTHIPQLVEQLLPLLQEIHDASPVDFSKILDLADDEL